MQDSIEAKLIKLSERLSEIEKQLIEESSTLSKLHMQILKQHCFEKSAAYQAGAC